MEETIGSRRQAEQELTSGACPLPTRIMGRLWVMVARSLLPRMEAANWVSQSSGTYVPLTGVSRTDANTGTAVGLLGTILRTTDGGTHWVPQSSGISNGLFGVSFTDANHGMICGGFGIILRTTDGGEHWIPETSGTDYDLSRISCTGARNGTAVGYGGSIFRREPAR